MLSSAYELIDKQYQKMKNAWLTCTSSVCRPPSNNTVDAQPTPEPLVPKRPRGWKCMPYIIGNSTFEMLASYVMTTNLTVYLVSRYGMKKLAAVKAANIFLGTQNFAPLIGAIISDAYCGRFWSMACGCISSFLGMVAFTVTASIPQLQPPICSQADQQAEHCIGANKIQLCILFISMALLVFGTGGVRPCSLPFGVDQFDQTSEHGQRNLNSYFNWYYCTSTAGLAIALTVVVYIQSNISWTIGFAICASFMLLAIITFFLGTRLYVYVPPEGSVFTGVAQVLVASFRKRNRKLPSLDNMQMNEPQLYDPPPTRGSRISRISLTQQFRCLNKAATVCEGDLNADGTPTNPWTLCSIQQVEEVKCLIRVFPIWATGIISLIAVVQQWTFTVVQALEMDRHLGPHLQIPPSSVGSIVLFTITIFTPVYDRIFVPIVRKITKPESGITLLQRQGVGMVFTILSMIVAGLVEHKRRTSALSPNGISSMSVIWLAPQLILVGFQETFNDIGQIEFYITQFPEHMQTLAGSLFYCNLAVASYLSSFMVTIIQRSTGGDGRPNWLDNNINVGRLDYFYYIIAGMGVFNLFFFLLCAHFYRYKSVKGGKESTELGIVPQRDGYKVRYVTSDKGIVP